MARVDKPKECSRGCGLVSRPGPMGKHENSCWTPATLERLYEIGSIDTSSDGCWEWKFRQGARFDWYPRIRQRKVSRLVCTLVYGDPSPGQRPLHSCDNRRCIRPEHLRWGSQAENVQDLYDHGRKARFQCAECSLVTFAGSMAVHQKHKDHQGWTIVSEDDDGAGS